MKQTIELTSERYEEALNMVRLAYESGGKAITLHEYDDSRSNAQNALSFKLYEYLDAYQNDSQSREVCKYQFGVPILIADDAFLFDWFKSIMTNMSYETRIKMMINTPVTSLMKVKQFTRYLEKIYNHYDAQGLSNAEA